MPRIIRLTGKAVVKPKPRPPRRKGIPAPVSPPLRPSEPGPVRGSQKGGKWGYANVYESSRICRCEPGPLLLTDADSRTGRERLPARCARCGKPVVT